MGASSRDLEPSEIDLRSRHGFLRWLGDSPFSALAAGQVRIDCARVLVLGDPRSPRLALIQSRGTPAEPAVFGPEVGSIWALLSRLEGWYCVNTPTESIEEIALELERRTGEMATRMGERYYVLERDPGAGAELDVRPLNVSDSQTVRDSDPLVHPFFEGHGGIQQTLEQGISAGVVRASRIVSAVTTSAWAGSHVDLGAVTVPSSRGQGLATASARRVCVALRERGLVPVWAAGEPNPASWHIPERLGFRFTGRREYAVLAGLRDEGFRR